MRTPDRRPRSGLTLPALIGLALLLAAWIYAIVNWTPFFAGGR
jgi:hypothetical protein